MTFIRLFYSKRIDADQNGAGRETEPEATGWVAVSAGAVAACATAIADRFVDCEAAPTPCAATICWIACPSAVAGGERVVIGVAFDGMLEFGIELTACPETISAEKSKPSLTVVNTVKRTMSLYLKRLELELTRSFWR